MNATQEFPTDAKPHLVQTADTAWSWTPMCRRPCGFGPEIFVNVMENLVHNPNLLSSWLFRADIVYDEAQAVGEQQLQPGMSPVSPARPPVFEGFGLVKEKTIVRRLIPRNTQRDKPMLQTCLFYEGAVTGHERHERHESHDDQDHDDVIDVHVDGMTNSRSCIDDNDEPSYAALVVYLPHIDAAKNVPFYHPRARGVGFLYTWQPISGTGSVSVHFAFYPETAQVSQRADHDDRETRKGSDKKQLLDRDKSSRPVLLRVALNLIQTICKHGEGQARGYVKRVHHDQLVSQARVQNRYGRLKDKYARRLLETWQETTDPQKHVFEDLSIAAFLMELWADMYGEDGEREKGGDDATVPCRFPGFVDLGCGNGLLVHLLREEGYRGWGFDARQRRSWLQYGNDAGQQQQQQPRPLQQALLLPHFLTNSDTANQEGETSPIPTHDGTFPPGTFLIANHADELTIWTPLLAALSDCPFLAIPCCSHNFTGAKFRAPPPSAAKQATLSAVSLDASSSSTYASFVAWIMDVAEDCTWHVEREMLRIPSTRNVGLLGRRRLDGGEDGPRPPFTVDDAWRVIRKYGGAYGFADAVAKLAVSGKKASH